MSTKKIATTAKTPQPPPTASTTVNSSTLSKSRTRSSSMPSTPTVIPPLIASPPGNTRLNPSRTKPSSNNASSSSKPTHNNNDHNNSPRPATLTNAKEPATEEEDRKSKRSAKFNVNEPNEESNEPQWLRTSNANIKSTEKQAMQMLHDVTTNNAMQQTRYTYMCDTMTGKEEQLTKLQGSYESLQRELRDLESLCDIDMDPATLDELYMSLPLDQRGAEDD